MAYLKRKDIILIIILLLVSSFFRFYQLDKRGLFEWDEGYYTQLVGTYRAAIDYFIQSKLWHRDIGTLGDYLLSKGGCFKSVFKDGFTYLATLMSFVFGMDRNTLLYSNAFVGTITVILLFLFLKKIIMDNFLSFIVSLCFAVSPYHIAYSRSAHAVISSAAFLLISVSMYLIYLKEELRKDLFYAGLFLGASFSCHYIIGTFVMAFYIYQFYFSLVKRRIRELVLFTAGFLSPLILLELISQIIKFFIRLRLSHLWMANEFVTYFERFFNQIREASKGPTIENVGILYYLQSLYIHEGIIIVSFLILILAILIIKRQGRPCNYFLIIIFLCPFLVLLFILPKADRILLPVLPLLYLVIGYGLQYFKKFKKPLVLLLLISIFLNIYKSTEFFNHRSNFDKAIEFMKNNGGIKHISDDMYVSRSYAGRLNAVDDFVSLKEKDGKIYLRKIEELQKNGYRHLLIYNIPFHLNILTQTALTLEADFSIPSIGSNKCDICGDIWLLRSKPDTPPCRYIYVYSLDKVIRKLESMITN